MWFIDAFKLWTLAVFRLQPEQIGLHWIVVLIFGLLLTDLGW
jgi:hypothetical protein